MSAANANAAYDARLREILEREDWEALREFTRAHNELPDDVYEKEQHFWEVLLHKLVCNRPDMLARQAASRTWLQERGYTTDIGGY